MYTGYMFPFYRSPYYGYGYPGIGPGFGYGGYGYGVPGGFGGYGSFTGVNAIGSAISTQNLVNTGTAIGVTQTSTPTAIW